MLKYNSALEMMMWTEIETLKANRVSLPVFLAQKSKMLSESV